jgi:hypothetical protein
VETRVSRLSPPGSAVVIEVPLLSGESVTTEGVRVVGGKALVNLGPADDEVSWSGVLPAVDTVALQAPAGVPWVEVWAVEASTVWHVEEKGIPPLHDETPRPGGARAWRPWPGEELVLSVRRPEGVAGRTLTIEKTRRQVRPGLRSTDVTWTLSMRASRGGPHAVQLPPGAELLRASVNGAEQPLRPDDAGRVHVPVLPGAQTLELSLRVPHGIAAAYAAPALDAGAPSVNAELVVEVPADRWVLFAWGPRAGPAVLFWSFLVVIVLTGVALSRVPLSPLKTHHWVLLSLGLTQVDIAVAALGAGWLLCLGWRQRHVELSPSLFNLRQVLVVGWTAVALIALAVSIPAGLLGRPDMIITGNGSSASSLRWYADHADALLPSATVWSAPMWLYRVSMLAWSLWLAAALLGWLRQGWLAFAAGGFWRAVPKKPRPTPSKVVAPEVPGAPTSAAVPSTPASTGPDTPKG